MRQIIANGEIEQKIFIIRGQKVMLDKDLAVLYGTETKVLNQAVKRNIERFPEDFMFSLTRSEIARMSQIVTSLKFSKNVNVFTEQGVAMLSSVLRSKRAILVNVAIMRAFVRLRKIISAHKELAFKLSELERKIEGHDTDIKDIFEAIRQLMGVSYEHRKITGFADK
jgi:hypothetical protein